MNRPLLLDAFCGAGGAAMGYHRAGFEVIGVDISPQPRYPFEFYQGDALDFIRQYGKAFDATHASPPCQHYSTASGVAKRHYNGCYPDLIEAVRRILQQCSKPYIIENVVGSPLIDPIILCGSSFGLDLRRHRLFESNISITPLPCDHTWQTPRFQSLDGRMAKKGKLASVVGVHGNCNYAGEFTLREQAMGINWMTNAELVQAVPPAYAEYIGRFLMEAISRQPTDNAQLHPDVGVGAHHGA